MTKEQYESLKPSDVIRSNVNGSTKTLVRDGSPCDPIVQIQKSRIEDTYDEYEIVVKAQIKSNQHLRSDRYYPKS